MALSVFIADVLRAAADATIDYIINIAANEPVTGSIATASGKCVVPVPDGAWAIALLIKPVGFHQDLVRLRKAAADNEWLRDNPVARIVGSPVPTEVHVTVSRMRPAPVSYIPDSDLAKLAQQPDGVLTTNIPEGLGYHSLFEDNYQPFFRLNHPILKSGTPRDAKIWDRLHSTKLSSVDPKKSGPFFHLEYGAPGTGPRLFLSIFVPRPGARKNVDFIVFFSPSTAIEGRFPYDSVPFRRNYPYGLTKLASGSISQEYPRHSQGYLFNMHHLAHQLVAADSNAVLVMPVAPFGDWSIFQTRSGLHRLLLELAAFLLREMLVIPQFQLRTVSPYDARAGGSVRKLTGLGVGVGASIFAPYQDRPPIGRVAVSAFSGGSQALQTLLVNKTNDLPKGFEPAQFGGSAEEFGRLFAEVWDFDCAHAPYHGYPAFERALHSWYVTGNKSFRLYHSTFTGGDRDSLGVEPLASLVTSSDIQQSSQVSDAGGTHWAQERYSAKDQWSSARFADGFLQSNDPGPGPPYWTKDDAHHFVPRIALGHAALLFSRPR